MQGTKTIIKAINSGNYTALPNGDGLLLYVAGKKIVFDDVEYSTQSGERIGKRWIEGITLRQSHHIACEIAERGKGSHLAAWFEGRTHEC